MIIRGRIKVTLAVVFALVGFVLLGTRAVPGYRWLALGLFAVGLAAVGLAVREKRARLRPRGVPFRRLAADYAPHATVAVALLAGAWGAWVLVPIEPSRIALLGPAEFRDELAEDFRRLEETMGASSMVLDELADLDLAAASDPSSAAERGRLAEAWTRAVVVNARYDGLREKHRSFSHVDMVARPADHADSFCLAFTAFVQQYLDGLRATETLDEYEPVRNFLNEPTELVPADSYFDARQRLTHPDALLRLNAGAAYLQLVRASITDPRRAEDLQRKIDRLYRRLGEQPDVFVDNPLDFLERQASESWRPVQKGLALQMSYLRTTDRDYFISPELLAEYHARLQPGDVLVERRNWHVTNVGIPGFWPHAAFYVGRFEDLDAAFAGVEIPDATPEEAATGVSAWLAARHPEACDAWRGNDENGFPFTCLEAKRPGVIFLSLEESGRCDYLAAMRPRLTPEQRLRVLDAALSHHGKPYDYDFNFDTDGAMVCSELVCKSLAAGSLVIRPTETKGRRLFTPNQLVQLFDEEFGEPAQRLDFVFFLRGIEASGEVLPTERIDFRRSWKRPKWDVAQE